MSPKTRLPGREVNAHPESGEQPRIRAINDALTSARRAEGSTTMEIHSTQDDHTAATRKLFDTFETFRVQFGPTGDVTYTGDQDGRIYGIAAKNLEGINFTVKDVITVCYHFTHEQLEQHGRLGIFLSAAFDKVMKPNMTAVIDFNNRRSAYLLYGKTMPSPKAAKGNVTVIPPKEKEKEKEGEEKEAEVPSDDVLKASSRILRTILSTLRLGRKGEEGKEGEGD